MNEGTQFENRSVRRVCLLTAPGLRNVQVARPVIAVRDLVLISSMCGILLVLRGVEIAGHLDAQQV